MTVDHIFLTGDYIGVHDNRPLMRINIHFETLTWSSICSNHSANHSHECPLGGPDHWTNWNQGSYVAYCVQSVSKICKVRACHLKKITFTKTV